MPADDTPPDQRMANHVPSLANRASKPSDYESGISLSDFVDAIVRDRRVVAAIVLVCGALATLAAFIITPVYRAQVVLMPVDEQRQGGALAEMAQRYAPLTSLAGVNLAATGTDRVESIAVLRSRSFIEDFIRAENLLPILYSDEWDDTARRWKDVDSEPTMDDAFDLFSRWICSIKEETRTGLVTLAIDWRDPEQAAHWANAMVARVNARMRQRAIGEAEATIAYLEKELDTTTLQEIRQSIYRLIESRIREKSLANVRSEYAFRVIDPATVSDLDNFVRPKRAFIIALGVTAGFALSLLVVFVRTGRRRQST